MTVSEQIIQVLDALCEKFGIVIDWTSANVMPYLATLCEKLVTWEIWTSVAWMGVALIGLAASIVVLVLSIKYFDDFDVITVPGVIGASILGIVCIGGFIEQIFDIIKCVTFPEMFVFEYVKELLSSGG